MQVPLTMPRRLKNSSKIVLLIILGTLASLAILTYFSASFVWVSLLWFAVFIYATIVEKRPILKPIWFNIGFLIIALGSIETYAWLKSSKDSTRMAGSYAEDYFTSDDLLGYGPVKGEAVTSQLYHGEDLIYDVVYTINSHGLRISPSDGQNPKSDCVLFFGGSFTFGQGVNDQEAMPYVVDTKSKYSVHNFGFHGYGPHQMLAALEHGRVENIVACQPKFLVYQTLSDNVARSAGYASWDEHGPRYVLRSDGSVEYQGHFDDERDEAKDRGLTRDLLSQLNRSFLFKRYFADRFSVNSEDVDLFVGIVAASKDVFQNDYPEGRFHVIFWNVAQDNLETMIIKGLKSKGIHVHLIGDILPHFADDPSIYQLSPYDRHPNALAHQLIAEYVVANILGE